MTTPVVEAPLVVVEHVQPDPVTENATPAPAVTYAAEQALVNELNAPPPAESYAALVHVVESIAPASA